MCVERTEQTVEGKLRGSEYFTNAGTAAIPRARLQALRVFSDFANRTLLSAQASAKQPKQTKREKGKD